MALCRLGGQLGTRQGGQQDLWLPQQATRHQIVTVFRRKTRYLSILWELPLWRNSAIREGRWCSLRDKPFWWARDRTINP
jgi:hypothetical protein